MALPHASITVMIVGYWRVTVIGATQVIDMDHHDHEPYLRPALVRIGAIVDIAAELEKLGITGLQIEYHPGDPIDWSNGRVS